MYANPIAKRRQFKPKRFHVSHAAGDRRKRREPIHRYPLPLPPVTDDEEMTFVAKAAIGMAVLGVTPLILFYIVNFFNPDFLWIPIAPN